MSLTVLQVACLAFPLHQGSQVYVRGMCAALARRGHRVLLATYGGGEGAWPEGVERVDAGGPVGVPRASGPHPARAPLDAALAWRLAAVLRRERVDVVHAHHVEAPLVVEAAARLAGVRSPLVWNPHTSLEEELPVYLPRPLRPAAAAAGRRLDHRLARSADVAVALSRAGEAHLQAWGARRVVRVPPGVDASDLAPGDADRARRRWLLGDRPWVVYTGNVDPYQDLDVLVEAVAALPDAGLLVVTGGDPRGLVDLAREAGLPAVRLRVVRSPSYDDARDALAAATVAALPRAVCAGFPIKLLNMLGAGRVVVTAQGSAQPIEGVVPVPGREPRALAGAIRALLDDPFGRSRLEQAARRAVLARWSWDARAQELEAVYRSL